MWTSLEQLTFLWERFPVYRDHQAEQTTVDFWGPLFTDWLVLWPETDAPEWNKKVSGDDGPNIRTVRGVVSTASIVALTNRRQRLKQWFNNKSRTASSGSGGKRVLDLTGRTARRRLAPYQTYQTLYWTSKLQAIVEPEWQEHLDTTPGETASGALAFRNRRCRELLAEESDEVRNQVAAAFDEGVGEEIQADVDPTEAKLQELQE
ncbi:hypothetical protein FA95DRAFT_1506931 [Auriscalpium vulgare]|uniref:Uncharacterized protein n=1 Tax=Auriscalpium vulgare TaxID=40419 RepID=A0ACB8R0A4_9AGAM|nr:hypothetical protein FA95DRAFT_1506931 [Auriscalpium vulgare]